MKKVIITGANGFIGSHLIDCMLEHGVEVYAMVMPGTPTDTIQKENVHIIPLDLKDISTLPSLISSHDIDSFYHLAWAGVYGEASFDYVLQAQNIIHACDAVKVAKKLGCHNFIYPSSVMEYDCMRSSSSKDGVLPNSRTSYYGAKMAAYLLSKHLASRIGIDYIEAVISNIYGPTMNPGFVTNTLLQFIKGEHASFSSGEQFYDFVHIYDAVSSLYYLGAEGKGFTSYYIGSNNPRKLKYFIMDMRDCVDPNIKLGLGEIKTAVVDMNLNDFDTQKLSRETGYEQKISFKDGIQMTVDYLRSELAKGR
jgi:UDP-glucose 4-epimerase